MCTNLNTKQVNTKQTNVWTLTPKLLNVYGDIHTRTHTHRETCGNKLCSGAVEKEQPRLHAGIHVLKNGSNVSGCENLNTAHITVVTVTLPWQFDCVQQSRTMGLQNISETGARTHTHTHTSI